MDNRADDLRRIISHLDTLWDLGEECTHPDTGEIVSNQQYDALRFELEKIDTKTAQATPSLSNVAVVKKITHNPPLTSISKASNEDRPLQEEQLFKWISDCVKEVDGQKYSKIYDLDAKEINGVQYEAREYNGKVVTYPRNLFYQAYKLDGAAIGLYYENGNLVGAGLRPRGGIEGEDVTEQVKYVSGIPQKLKLPVTCSIRGELICKLKDFDKVQKELEEAGEDLRANPRNHAAGGIRQFKNPSKVKDQRLSFIAYGIEGLDNPPYKTEIERAKWCNQELGITFVQVRPFNFYDLQVMEDNAKDLDYEVDGVVIGVNDLEDQEQLGHHGDTPTGNPRGKIAWKFAEERATPILKEKEWNTGRTGAIKPVGIFDVVPLAGTQVRRATLHNLGFIFRNKIEIGTQIVVLKAGKIIPKVIGVASKAANYKDVQDVDFPKQCPSCGCDVEIKYTPATGSHEEMYELVCPNKDNCPAQNINGLCHYLKTFGVLGLGDSKVAALVEGGAVKVPADFYKLNKNDVMACGLSDRQALLAIAGIHMISSPEKYEDKDLEKQIFKIQKKKKVIPLWRLFASFGIESAGKSAGKALVDHFGNFDKIRQATVEELSAVKDVGVKTAQIISDYLHKHIDAVDDLLKYVEPELPKTGPLSGKSFVLTGGFAEGGKKHWEAAIEAQGGKCSSSVSKNTTYVVEGTDAGSKADKARKLGVPLIDVSKLKKILEQK
ncbi:MAG: NAD-dependent DNA ligase LigA [Crenarchaeota archaeon]|nr:MAG: NAD-dependent DNA ligase LigA [Thermoproteota archaeon]